MKNQFTLSQIDPRIIEWLQQKGYTKEEELLQFFYPQKSHLTDPMVMQGMQQAVARIQKALQNKETIVIYGDYDCDGVCATSILYLYFQSLGVTPQVFIPHRFENGYGLSSQTIEHILSHVKPNLLITVDCGITALAEIQTLQQYGVDVIVTDHHEPASALPSCTCVDPKTDPQAAFQQYCGAGVAFKLVQALGGLEAAMQYIDLAAVATIGDIVPLTQENRTITTLGLQKLQTTPNKGLQELLVACKLTKPTATDIAFKIVPKINSCGRMHTALTAFSLLTQTSPAERVEALKTMLADNEERLKAKDIAVKQADAQIEQINFETNNALVVVSPNIPEGVLGIVASYMVNTYQKPSFVFTKDKDGNYKGSARGVEGQDLHAQLLPLPYFKALGGHKLACGMTVYAQHFEAFCNFVSTMPVPAVTITEPPHINITPEDISLPFVQQLELLEPTGFGNEKPLCALTTNAHQLRYLKGGKHVQLVLPQGKEITCFFAEPYVELLQADVEKTLYLQLQTNVYQGIPKAQAIAHDVQSCKALPATYAQAQAMLMLSQYALSKNTQTYAKQTMPLQTFLQQAQASTCQYVVWGGKEESTPLPVSYTLPLSRINTQLYGFKLPPNAWKGYTHIYVNQTYYHPLQFQFLQQQGKTVVYAPDANLAHLQVNTTREFFAQVFAYIKQQPSAYKNANNLYTFAECISNAMQQPLHHVMFALLVFIELGIVKQTTEPVFTLQAKTNVKKQLSASALYQLFSNT